MFNATIVPVNQESNAGVTNQLMKVVPRTPRRAVASLPPGYRMVFVLHDVEGFEHNEIATMLDCSTGNSKSQLHKARLRLRELLRNPNHSPDPDVSTEATK